VMDVRHGSTHCSEKPLQSSGALYILWRKGVVSDKVGGNDFILAANLQVV